MMFDRAREAEIREWVRITLETKHDMPMHISAESWARACQDLLDHINAKRYPLG